MLDLIYEGKTKMKLTIGIDGSRAFIKGRTGTENYSYQLLKNLASIDTENIYFTYLRPGCQVEGEWPENFHFKMLNFTRLWTQLGLSLQTFKDNLDLLYIPAHTLPLVRKPGLKTLLTVHDLGAEYLAALHQLKQRLYLGLMTNFQLKSATKLLAVSESTKKDIVKRVGVLGSKVKVVYEGIDTEFFKVLEGDALNSRLKKLGLEKNKYFLFVGTIQPRKNLERLIRAFRDFSSSEQSEPRSTLDSGSSRLRSNISLVIAGSKGWMADEIYELPKKLGIENKVRFLGRVEDKDLPALYSGALAFVYPSLFEGFGLPILEAQACGTPVITSSVTSTPEVAGDAAILVNPHSESEITKAMEEITDKTKRERLIKLGFENVKRFSWKDSAKETLKLFEEVAGG